MEAEKRSLRRDLEVQLNQKADELIFAKKKLTVMEQDRNTIHDKYSKISIEHAKCDQSQKEMRLKLVNMEKEITSYKQILEDVKKGKVDKLFLTKEQEAAFKKGMKLTQQLAPEAMTQYLYL